MFIKHLSKPYYLDQLESASRRIAMTHHKHSEIVHWRTQLSSNYYGEKKILPVLTHLSSKESRIFFDLRLPLPDHSFCQIDVLIVTRNFALILEVNHTPLQSLTKDYRFMHVNERMEARMPDPLSQAELQAHQLTYWLSMNGFQSVPINYFVVLTSPASYSHPSYGSNSHVVHLDQLITAFQTLNNVYTSSPLEESDLNRLCDQLMIEYAPYQPFILDRFRLKKSDILQGVICPECSALPMKRLHGRWYCKACHHTSRNAHVEALKDYQFLFGERITNQRASAFLKLDSSTAALQILNEVACEKFGMNKTRYYVFNH
ncbi:Nuclease-related domain-containing protein [Halobacillus alkaliphilus]|uniref:Nuclease-related domain-containing protein n=1 Tax=Halobacillus alkaliphilus TaxID=396056 RepID=A0A1I2MBG7_9BACI|nr:nuclease-related domain-containing protein [Halobacillus alkaliphilus]SFF86716.1 Nuclease-related domain-containing protein [Halobacillus alkaliphilus]